MKVAIIGGRDFKDYDFLKTKCNLFEIDEIVSGGARGADTLAERYAEENNIPIKIFYPNWSLGKHAGILRNDDIIKYADMVIAFWDGKSKGTGNSIYKTNTKYKKELYVYEYSNI